MAGDAQSGAPGRQVLIAGAGAIADGRVPAIVMVDLGPRHISPAATLELLLSPSLVIPNERYLIVVSAKIPGGEKRLGAVSFFPPRPGVTQAFYFNLSALRNETAVPIRPFELSIALVPASREQGKINSSIRVIDALLLGE